MKEFLKQVYASLRTEGDAESQNVEKAQLRKEVVRLRKADVGLVQCISFLREEYADDRRLYMELLRYLVETTADKLFACELLHCMMIDALDRKEDFFEVMELMNQTTSAKALLGLKMEIEEEWKLMLYFRDEMQEMIHASYEMIPLRQRNNDYIIVVSTSLLSPAHAPTKYVLELCRILEIYLQKKVLLLSEVQETNQELVANLDLKWYYCRDYLKECNGNFSYEYKGHTIDGYQIVVKKENLYEMQRLIWEIYQQKPYCVWCFGEMSVYASVMQQFTTFLYMSFNQGYLGVPADIAINYFPGASVWNKKRRDFLLRHGVKVKDIEFIFSYPKAVGTIKRSDYEIPDKAFVMAVVGNRLETDCTPYFLSVLKDVIKTEPECYVVFIGGLSTEFQAVVIEQLEDSEKTKFMGYQNKLEEAIAITDLFVNPPNLGGGTGAIFAMNEGKPIVTLNRGDVASFAGEAFICAELKEYPNLIKKYISDSAFYCRKSELAKKRVQKMTTDDEKLGGILRDILEMVKE